MLLRGFGAGENPTPVSGEFNHRDGRTDQHEGDMEGAIPAAEFAATFC